MQYKNKKSRLLNFLGEFARDNRGSILALVILVGACLFIVTAALMLNVNVNTNSNKVLNNSERAYLAAKSGMQLLQDIGSDSGFINEVYKSCDNDPFVMNFGELGNCEIKITSTADPEVIEPSGNKKKYVLAECTGKYEGEDFVMTRKICLTGTPTGTPPTNNDIPLSAYKQFSENNVQFDGAMDGHTDVLTDAVVTLKNASYTNPIDTINCFGSINLKNSGILANTLAGGRSLYLDKTVVKDNVYIGAKDDTGNLKDNIFFYSTGNSIGGAIMCEGDVIVSDFNGGETVGYVNGIGADNYDKANDALISKDFAAIKAGNGPGSKVYLGYAADVNDDCTSYTNVRVAGNKTNVYGGVLCNGDLYIASDTSIYGDIVCSGKVTIAPNTWGVRIYGDIYANEVSYELGTYPNYMLTAFPNGCNIYTLGESKFVNLIYTETTDSEGNVITLSKALESYGVHLHQNQSTVDKLISVAGNFVGAADYFEDIKEENGGGKRPTTEFPDELAGLPSVQFAKPACGDTMVANYLTGMNDNNASSNVLHITGSCRLDNDITLNGWGPVNYIYIDTSLYDNNIDIYLNSSIITDNAGAIIINDNGGKNYIRFFMEDGSGLQFKSSDSSYPGFLVVSDEKADMAFSPIEGFVDLPYSTNDLKIDQSKVPNLFIFAKEPDDKSMTSSVYINIGQHGYVPGYILTPYADIISESNAHCYVSGTKVGYDPNNDSAKMSTNVPFIYGMVMCHSAKLEGGTTTSVKFDEELVNDPEKGKIFNDATSNVYYYDKPDGSGSGSGSPTPGGSGGSGVGGFNWNITEII